MSAPRTVVVADDLTGAVESAAALAGLSGPVPAAAEVVLDVAALREPDASGTGGSDVGRGPAGGRGGEHEEPPWQATIVSLDLDSRAVAPQVATVRLLSALEAARRCAGPGGRVIKKIDSLWRGNTAAEVRTLIGKGPAVIVPALPALGRTVRDGVLHGVADGAPDPAGRCDLVHLLEPHVRSVRCVDLRVVRSRRGECVRMLAGIVNAGGVALVDAETDDDLDLVAAALAGLPDELIISTGGLAAALGRRARRERPEQAASPMPSAAPGPAERDAAVPRRIAVLVGSTEPAARAQIGHLAEAGVPVIEVTGPDAGASSSLAPVVVLTTPAAGDRPCEDGSWARALVDCALARYGDADFVATGGATARALVDGLGLSRLQPLAEAYPGAVVSRTPSGRFIATRPGSFGGLDSLAVLVQRTSAIRLSMPPDRKADR
ncbi:four-carbon acid sugar kinase family protein [Propionicicella superfundia]|uniref:four-carbon acid sugar kinase family protein n=1 Tax=Propionicicella superfundia TaxID=348582 RepID=UPI000405F3F1|nr:four-carbon acid sugar kinase family protein [Propionicicella superfundia]